MNVNRSQGRKKKWSQRGLVKKKVLREKKGWERAMWVIMKL